MLFSFVVPVYNTSKYLDKCMESILCQKGAEYEVVLVDDGSTDGSSEMCDSYVRDYPAVVRVIHKENEGSLQTRHRGIQESKGDWILCIDSDDYIDKDYLCTITDCIHKYNPDLIIFNFSYVDDNEKVRASSFSFNSDELICANNKEKLFEKRLLTDEINSMCLKAVNRDLLDTTLDYSHCIVKNMADDAVEVLPILTNAERTAIIKKPLYYYRKGHQSTTSNVCYENWGSIKNCFFITEEYLGIWKVSNELKSRFYTRNIEILSNFLRWANSQPDEKLEKTFDDIIHIISSHPAFKRCMQMYNKAFAKTLYLKFSVPKIMKYVKKENVNGLKRYFSFEKKIRR